MEARSLCARDGAIWSVDLKWLAVIVALWPQMGQALSCAMPSLTRDYAVLSQTPGLDVLIGRVVHNADYQTDEEAFGFDASFVGDRMLPDGTRQALSGPAFVSGQCINGDCGYLAGPDEVQILFARFHDATIWITVYPCAATPALATETAVAQMAGCVTGGTCE